jgi:hypothetical protein
MKARYPDVCPRCGRDIRVGDDIVPRRGRSPIHRTCASGQDDDADQ